MHCESCDWVKRVEESDEGPSALECRRFPPRGGTVTAGSVSVPVSLWPRVEGSDYCGEYTYKGHRET